MKLFPRMLGLVRCWEPQVFNFSRNFFTLVNICYSLYGAVEKQRESQDSVE